MKVLCFIVNYRADGPLRQCVESLRRAALGVDVQLEVHVLDNSEYDSAATERLRTALAPMAAQLHLPQRNLGYFGGLRLAQRLAAEARSDCVIYSNPDVCYAPDFFARLLEVRALDGGVLAPAIVARDDGFDQNPKYLHRLSRERLSRLRRIYSSRPGFMVYMGLARVKEKLAGVRRGRPAAPAAPAGRIYAPHGAVFMFADVGFFSALPEYPCFLFGEELFVAEEALGRGVPIVYRPALRVDDLRSQSVRQLPGDFHRRLMLRSVEFILDRYYGAGA